MPHGPPPLEPGLQTPAANAPGWEGLHQLLLGFPLPRSDRRGLAAEAHGPSMWRSLRFAPVPCSVDTCVRNNALSCMSMCCGRRIYLRAVSCATIPYS